MSNISTKEMPTGSSNTKEEDMEAGGSKSKIEKRVHFMENEITKVDLRHSLLTPLKLENHVENIQFYKGIQIKEHVTEKQKSKIKFLELFANFIKVQHVLSALIVDSDSSATDLMPYGYVISGSLDMRPMRRNVLKIEPVKHLEETDDDNTVKYDQHVYLSIMDTDEKLFLSCKKVHRSTFDFITNKYPIKLLKQVDDSCIFQILNFCHADHEQINLQKIPIRSTVAIKHTATKRFITLTSAHYESKLLDTMDLVVACSKSRLPESDEIPNILWELHTDM